MLPETDELTTVYRETIQSLYQYVSWRTGGRRALSEDIVQETYVRAFESWHKQKIENPMAWLRSIAHNLLVSYYRKKKPASLEDLGWDPSSDAVPTDSPEKADWIQWGLTQLGKKDSHILEMFYFCEFNTREISKELHISERAVEGRLRRARQKLKKALMKCGHPSGGYSSVREA